MNGTNQELIKQFLSSPPTDKLMNLSHIEFALEMPKNTLQNAFNSVGRNIPKKYILPLAELLGCYGFALPTSPILDRFATEGVLFEQVIAPANWTLPSHATMLTGFPPCVHGKHSVIEGGPLPPGITPLAEILRREGYVSAGFTEDGHIENRAGLFH